MIVFISMYANGSAEQLNQVVADGDAATGSSANKDARVPSGYRSATNLKIPLAVDLLFAGEQPIETKAVPPLSLQSEKAFKPGESAFAWAMTQRDTAQGSVTIARNRVVAAETDLRISHSVEQDIRNSKDSAAIAIAREAVIVSEQGVLEAKALLKRAMDFLAKQENILAAVGASVAKNGSNKALVVPVSGQVRRLIRGVYIDADPTLPLQVGERVEVGPGSSARLFVAGGDAEVALSQNTSFTITLDDPEQGFYALLSEGFARVRKKAAHFNKKFEVRTPNGGGAVRGTDFSMKASPTATRIEVFKGVVWAHLPDSEQGIEVHAGEGCDILKDGGIQSVKPLDNQPRENPWSDNATSY